MSGVLELAPQAVDDCPFRDLLEDSEITEILQNGLDETWVEKNGKLVRLNQKLPSEEFLRKWVRRVLSEKGRKVDICAPFADCILPDGSRLHVVGPPISRRGLFLSIRKFPQSPWTLNSLRERGALSEKASEYLKRAVLEKRNIFISGGTGTGKTSLLGALIKESMPHERIIALEDVAELNVAHPHFLSLEARPVNQEGEGEVTLGRLLREALRMRPDRIVVGECRGAEALDLLLALNSGHGGSMGTIHSNSPRDALQRLETLGLLACGNLGDQAIKNLISGGIHLVIQVERAPEGRRVSSIVEVKGVDSGRFLLKEIPI